MNPCPQNRQAGYLLMETVVAMALLSIGIVAIHGALQQAIIVRGQAQDVAMARHMLEQVISKIEMQPRLVEGDGSGVGEGALDRFRWTWKVSKITLPDPPVPPNVPAEQLELYKLKARYLPKIEATISWTRNGRDFKETAQTLWYPAKLYVPKEQQEPQ
jgi:hypothetical protein